MGEQKKKIKIMVVDDEEVVRDLLGEIMEIMGYESILVDSPIRALDIYKERSEEIDLMLIDMIMPELTGAELYREIKAIKSNQKVVLLSGYSDENKTKQMLDEGIVGFVQKPVAINDLSKIIQQSLEK